MLLKDNTVCITYKTNSNKKIHLLSKIHVAGAMNEAFCQKFQILIGTIKDFLIVMIIKICALSYPLYKSICRFSNRCFKAADTKISVHHTNAALPWLTENTKNDGISEYENTGARESKLP